LIYTSEANTLAFNGYSYTTQDFNGGESNVIFTTGADSMSRLKNEINSIKLSKKYSQKNKNQENMFSEQQSKSVEVEESKNKQDLDSNIEVSNEEKKFSKNPEVDNNFIEHQTNLQQVSFIDVSYPAFRENLLNLYLPRYHISSNVIQSQYYPYTRLEPSQNFGFYNPIVPLFYQTAAVISDSNSKSTSTAIKNVEASMESHVTKNSHTNVTSSESSSVKSSIESRFNLESTTNAIEETSSSQSAISTKKLEFMIIPVTSSPITSEKIREEITTSESIVTSQNSIEQTTDNKANSTELASTETNALTEKATSKKYMKHFN